MATGGGKWPTPPIKHAPPPAPAKAGGSSGAGSMANKHANTSVNNKGMAATLASKNR